MASLTWSAGRPRVRFLAGLAAAALLLLTRTHPVLGQSYCTGTETFDKVTGVTLQSASKTPLFSAVGSTVTAECNNRCRASLDCPSFLIDYDKEACFRLDTNTEDNRELIQATSGRSNYFEKVCLQAPACEKAWIYERVIGYVLAGYDDRIVGQVGSRKACQELCLLETEFQCQSAEYVYNTQECRLSSESRRSQPASFRATTEDVDYLENQCAREKKQAKSCDYEAYEGQDLGYADIQVVARNPKECQDQCEQTSAFNCRSFTFFPGTGVCRLSGDDNISAGPAAVTVRRGADYYQRAPCLDWSPPTSPPRQRAAMRPKRQADGVVLPEQPGIEPGNGGEVSLSCTGESMTVKLNTEEPFLGRIFAQSKGKECEARGNARSETELTFLFEPEAAAKCGVQKETEKGVYSNVIVIQHHPVIQRKGDRAIQLYCYFETGDKVVTNSYDVLSDTIDGVDTSTPSSVVNATAPSPGVRLRITTADGEDISGTRLGEKLFLRIEMDRTSIFGIFARNLKAISGDDNERIDLLDDKGCPTDPAIFPGLQKVTGTRDLQGAFEAFKFSDTSVVRFQVNVQFCVDDCNPVNCADGIQSYGRRRRDIVTRGPQLLNVTDNVTLPPYGTTNVPEPYASRLVYDPNLGQDVILSDTPLSKEIIVDPGTKVDSFRDPRARSDFGPAGIIIHGDEEGELLCTTLPVVIATAAAVLFLQLCIIVTCLLCLYTAKRGRKGVEERAHSDRQSLRSSRSSSTSSSQHGMPTLYHDNLTFRPTMGGGSSRLTENTASTLKSLRTSLRD